MRVDDLDVFNEDFIRAALDAAINQPLANLLAIAEYAEKAGVPQLQLRAAEEPPEPAEVRRAA